MNTRRNLSIHIRIAFVVCVAAAFAPQMAVADTPPVHLRVESASRLGASSAVADFNADGRPDLAVARRLSNHGGSNFRIDFQISNGRRQSVSFASAQSALRVTAVDVDNDHDIDLVVTPLLGHHVISVWLNDGAGNFRKGRAQDAAPFTVHLATATLNGVGPPFAVVTTSPRRLTARLSSPARAPAAIAAIALRSTASIDLPSRFLARSLAPRAPPEHA